LLATLASLAHKQDPVTGAFEGTVTDAGTQARISGALVQITNQLSDVTLRRRTDEQGRFYQGLLPPGIYTISVTAAGYVTQTKEQQLYTSQSNQVVPIPFTLVAAVPPATSASVPALVPVRPAAPALPPNADDKLDIVAEVNRTDGRRAGAFTARDLFTPPLGLVTGVHTFDELALLLPGVAPPPQTLGSVAGPGVGAGVGSAGQFAVNGLRSRANNFTVDGSDNNDEDIGVRRQGFVALNSQPLESVKEYQVTTLLAPAQFGRNIGAQVNAVSKAGGSATHGTVYGFFNSSQLNARNPFDTNFGNDAAPLRSASGQPVLLDGQPLLVRNESGGEDSFTFSQLGFVLGGPVRRARTFYFAAVEGYVTNASREENFAVPTIEQRGLFGSGASGLFIDPTSGLRVRALPTTAGGDAVFSLFPFPNNPQGVYDTNTLTQVLPASARGEVFSVRLDHNQRTDGRTGAVTGRYNFTNDRRDIPAPGGALSATLRPRVRTQNFSFFYNRELSAPATARPVFNQLRFSYGRTRLNFDEVRQPGLPPPVLAQTPFLLNAPLLRNSTLPALVNGLPAPNTGPVTYASQPGINVDAPTLLGPVGQINIAGFSPVGVDVLNFPQRRVNNTYQVADELSLRSGAHTYGFGVDARRSELNSELPRNARPLVTFSGAPAIVINPDGTVGLTNNFIRPETFAAASAAAGFSQVLARGGDAGIGLRFYQWNVYAQDAWRVRPNLSLSFGLRYEYNTPPHEQHRRIEQTFSDPALALIPGLSSFIGPRTSIFAPDRNNFAPRLGLSYAPHLFGVGRRATVLRAGYGLFYDQILGAVVSQSRNVFPTYLTVDFAGGRANRRFIGCSDPDFCPFSFLNPNRFALPGTLNTLSPNVSLVELIQQINFYASGVGTLPSVSAFGMTIPAARLDTPSAQHYDLTFEQQLARNVIASAAYVGTLGRHLLRFTTPNLGPNSFLVPLSSSVLPSPELCPGRLCVPSFFGIALPPGTRLVNGDIIGGRPVSGVGTVYRFETTARSRYDALQLQLRGQTGRALQYHVAYTFSRTTDDVSDVFDLAGASALPQDSFNLAAERGPANFDVRHRFTYSFSYELPPLRRAPAPLHYLFGNLQVHGTGSARAGQPFTVNSIFDVNLDGNLTDRLNNTGGLIATGDRSQPLKLTTDNLVSLLAPVGRNGQLGRNTFRAGNVVEHNLALGRTIHLKGTGLLLLRADIFNLLNRTNYGIPVRLLEAPAFGRAINTVIPSRRLQFSLKYAF
jgi:hypothetical protein